eukprot:TRINITY_DN93_c0_g1_i3.p1 TRINITY_DN93_c0_g1~~TRINITY_DN93_c0_g1_i3.p1  ORF type:complete len:373 (-),score=50.01 TRINITY_DN93_c0_g1_i3:4-1122(-)
MSAFALLIPPACLTAHLHRLTEVPLLSSQHNTTMTTTQGHTLLELIDPYLSTRTRPSLLILNHYLLTTLHQTTHTLKFKRRTTIYDLLESNLLTRFPNTIHLDLSHCELDNGILKLLIFFPQLIYLDLSYTNIDNGLLTRISVLERLEVLKLNGTRVDDGGLGAVCGLRDLCEFEVAYCGIDGGGFEGGVWGIERLVLNNCQSLVDLSGVSQMRELRYLDLSMISHLDGDSFLGFHCLSNLETLHLSSCEGLDDLMSICVLYQLKVLSLAWCDLVDDNILQLSELKDLHTLDISGNTKLSNICAAWLSLNNPSITRLDISGCPQITNEGLDQLSYLPNLQYLNIIECSIEETFVSSISISKPNLSIYHESTI